MLAKGAQASHPFDRLTGAERLRDQGTALLGDIEACEDAFLRRFDSGLRELSRGLLGLGEDLSHVGRNPNDLLLVGQGPADGVLDPVGRVGGEAAAPIWIEAIDSM